jgi:type I restriction-modification system DNA methylase subunit
MAVMNSKKKSRRNRFSEEDIDKIVESQAEEDLAWERPIKVRRAKSTAVSLPVELPARAAFLARLHREKNVGEWLYRIIKERVELEEVAFSEAKRAMSHRNGV